jgi:glycerol-3-phosphate acyltransferase PlsY
VGIILVINPVVFLLLVVIFVPFLFIVKIVSLGSILGAISYPILTWLVWITSSGGTDPLYDTCLPVSMLGLSSTCTAANIKKLLNGTEYKFGQKQQGQEKQ